MRLRVMRTSATTIFPLLGTLLVLAPVLVPAIYGEPWRPAVVPVQLLAVAGLAATVVTGCVAPLMALGRARSVMHFNLARFAAYAATIWFTAPHGIRTVCVGVIGFQLASVAASSQLLRRHLDIPYRALATEAGPALAATLALIGDRGRRDAGARRRRRWGGGGDRRRTCRLCSDRCGRSSRRHGASWPR